MAEARNRKGERPSASGGRHAATAQAPPAQGRGTATEAQERQGGLLGRVLELIGGVDDPARERRKLLKEYARRVARARPRLYNPRGDVSDPALGALFHTFYRVLGPARILLRNAKVSTMLKTVAVERCLNERQREVLLSIREEAIAERAKTMTGKDLLQSVRDDLGVFVKAFDRRAVDRARRSYHAAIHLVDLVNFDYWGVLRKFDARYPETDFTYNPRFLPVNGTYLTDALKDFVEVLAPIEAEADWKEVLAILRDYRGMDLVSASGWSQVLRTVTELRRSGHLLGIIRLIDGDPAYAPRRRPAEAKVVESYVEVVRKQAEAVLRKVLDTQRQQSVEALAREVFGDARLPALTGYTAAAGEKLARKGLPGLAHTGALAYAKAYLVELHKTRVKELMDALLIRATWVDTAVSRSLSDTYQDVLAVLPDILTLDERLGDNKDLGVKLKTAITRADRAKPQTIAQGRQVVESIDKQALSLVTRTIQGCGGLSQVFRTLVEDSGQANPKVVQNWKDLKGPTSKEDIRTQVVDVFRRLQAVAQLMRLTTNRAPELPPVDPVAKASAADTEVAAPDPFPTAATAEPTG